MWGRVGLSLARFAFSRPAFGGVPGGGRERRTVGREFKRREGLVVGHRAVSFLAAGVAEGVVADL